MFLFKGASREFDDWNLASSESSEQQVPHVVLWSKSLCMFVAVDLHIMPLNARGLLSASPRWGEVHSTSYLPDLVSRLKVEFRMKQP